MHLGFLYISAYVNTLLPVTFLSLVGFCSNWHKNYSVTLTTCPSIFSLIFQSIMKILRKLVRTMYPGQTVCQDLNVNE